MTFTQKHDVADLKEIDLQSEQQPSGLLTIMESAELPLRFERTFTVHGVDGSLRGRHAHRKCAQLLICLTNTCRVTCDDGREQKLFCLDDPTKGLYIPPSIWSEQTYEGPAILLVLCDRPYEEDDYIREYDEFLKYREGHI